jgi:hypothetical protein
MGTCNMYNTLWSYCIGSFGLQSDDMTVRRDDITAEATSNQCIAIPNFQFDGTQSRNKTGEVGVLSMDFPASQPTRQPEIGQFWKLRSIQSN